MKPDLFVDTSGWLAFITQNDLSKPVFSGF